MLFCIELEKKLAQKTNFQKGFIKIIKGQKRGKYDAKYIKRTESKRFALGEYLLFL